MKFCNYNFDALFPSAVIDLPFLRFEIAKFVYWVEGSGEASRSSKIGKFCKITNQNMCNHSKLELQLYELEI